MATNLGEFRIAKKSVFEKLPLDNQHNISSDMSRVPVDNNYKEDVRKTSSEEPHWNVKVNRSASDLVQLTSEPTLRIRRSNTEPPVLNIPSEIEPQQRRKEGSKSESDEIKLNGKRDARHVEEEEEGQDSFEKEKHEHRKLIRLEPLRSSSDSDASSKEDGSTPRQCNADHSNGKVVADFIITTDVFTLFTTIFTNSKFFNAFHTRRETIDVVLGDWTEDGSQTVRTNTFTVKLAQMLGPKQAKVKEKQVLLPVSQPGFLYAVNTESNNLEIQYSDSFYLTFHTCLTRIAPKETRVMVVADLKFRKFVWGPIKSLIEKTSWTGMANFYMDLELSLKKEFCEARTETPLPSPELSEMTTNSVRRRPLRKKRHAPSIPVSPLVQTLGENETSKFRRFLGSIRLNPLKSTSGLKVLICFLAILLLGFNAFLFIKVQDLETEIELNFSKSGFTPFDSEMQEGNAINLQELFYKQETLRYLTHSKIFEPIGMAIDKLKQVEEEIRSLQSLVNSL